MTLKEYIKFMRSLDLYVISYENDIRNKCYYIHYMLNITMWTEIIYKKDMKNIKKMEQHKKILEERVNYYNKKGV